MSTAVLKILSYNIHKGFSSSNQRFVLSGIKEGIKSTGADIVFLQEVVGQNTKHARSVHEWPSQAQFEFLADSIWPHYAYGKNSVYISGHHGNAILSAFPIVKWSNSDISTNRMEKRGLLYAKIELPEHNKVVDCFCVHLSLFESGRSKQMISITDVIKSEGSGSTPLILAGDFNDWRGNASKFLVQSLDLNEIFLKTDGKHARTYPSLLPIFQLDRIYVRGVTIGDARVLTGMPWSRLSDHSALYAEIEI
jgi:endonuclease/exonuclease/phosphatase family metal-dependent hydrolase